MVMAMANLAMATGNIGQAGVGVNPPPSQNNVKDLAIWGLSSFELSGYRSITDDAVRALFMMIGA